MTVESERLAGSLFAHGVTKLVGVPDSVLSGFCVTAAEVFGADNHVTTANEGSAVAYAIGHHLATGGLSAVYMQNSGLGNAVNPLVSLASSEVYAIPMILVIGWRGMPGTGDEPQHILQGRITEPMLDCLQIPHSVVCDRDDEVDGLISGLVEQARSRSAPVALLIPKGSLSSEIEPERTSDASRMSREEALRVVLEGLDPRSRVVSTTGMLSRELYENTDALREVRAFMTVGGMGHASTIALGLACAVEGQPVVCLDGDGAALMHLGSMVTLGGASPKGLVHVLFNNGVHDSVGGQHTTGPDFDFAAHAAACGYAYATRVSTRSEIASALAKARSAHGVSFVEILVNPGNRSGIGRPKEAMVSLKSRIMAE